MRAFALAVATLLALGAPAQATDADWHTYYDAAHGFSIAYPDGWTVNPQFTDKGYAFSQGDTDAVRSGVGISPTTDIAPGTNLESKDLVFAVQYARPGDTCRASAFLADPSPAYATQSLQDTPDLAHTLAEPGDVYSIEHVVKIVSKTPCVALQIYLVYRQIGLHDPHPPRTFDRVGLFNVLERIAATLKLRK